MSLGKVMKRKLVLGFMVISLLFSLFSSVASASTGVGTVTGVIKDLETGNPADGVLVKVYHGTNGYGGTLEGTVTTGADGRYTFDSVPEGDFYLTFDKAGYLSVNLTPNVRTVVEGQTAEVMDYNLTFSQVYGMIKNSQGADVGGVTVSVTGTVYTLTTPVNLGYFSFSNIPPGEHTLTISKEGYETLVTSSIAVIRGQYTGLGNITLLTESESPTTKSLVSLSATPQQVEVGVGETASPTITATYSDDSTADVTSQVTWLSSNTNVANVSTNGTIIGVAEGNNVIVTASLDGKSVTIPVVVTASSQSGTGAVKGSIIDLATHLGLSGASVSLYTGAYPGILFDTVTTNANGVYEFQNVPVNIFHLRIQKTGYVPMTVTPNANVVIDDTTTQVAEFTVFNTQVYGIVKDSNNEAIGNAIVKITGTDLATSTYANVGLFSFFNVPDGTYTLTISKSGYKELTTNSFTISQGVSVNLNTLQLVTDTGSTPGTSTGSTPGTSTGSTPGTSTGSTPGTSTGSTPGTSTGSTPGTSTGSTPSPAPGTNAGEMTNPAPTEPGSNSEKPQLDEKIVNAGALKEKVQKALETSTGATFNDVEPNKWSSSAVELAAQLGFITGYSDGSFKPNESITRAEFAKMLVSALGIETSGNAASFGDTQGHWAEAAINNLKANGIIGGYTDGSFKPDKEISRAEIATILSRILNLNNASGNSKLQDVTGNWAEDDINKLIQSGIINGNSENKFEPDRSATRAESVILILRLLNTTLNLDLEL